MAKQQYDPKQAGVQMTLSAIAYAGGDGTMSVIKTAIEKELKIKDYATGGNWTLVWGPVRTSKGDNLMYVAQNSQLTSQYAVVIRGTVFDVSSILQDLDVKLVDFDYVPGQVSEGFNKGFTWLIGTPDSNNGSLQSFLVNAAAVHDIQVLVTGHSLGGAIAVMMLAWIVSGSADWGAANMISAQGYTFAGPSAGDEEFSSYFDESARCWRVVNPLDVVPYGYANLLGLIDDDVPTEVPSKAGDDIKFANEYLKLEGYVYTQPPTRETLTKVQIPPSSGANCSEYVSQVGDQHNHNSYLYLLNVEQTDIGDPSVLPNYSAELEQYAGQ